MLSAIDTVTGAVYSVKVSQVRVGSRKLSFAPVNDTLPGIDRENFFSFLSTEKVNPSTPDDSILFDIQTYSAGWGKQDEKLVLTGSLAEEVPLGSLETNFDPRGRRLQVRMQTATVQGKDIGLSISGDLPHESDNMIYMLTHLFGRREEKDGSAQKADRTPEKAPRQDAQSVPTEFSLQQNYPNPFNPSTSIRFGLSESSFIEASIFDLLGRQVAVLLKDHRSAGYHSLTWNADGNPSGAYICRVKAIGPDGRVRERTIRLQYVR
jgi:hypothetical protein